MTYKYPGLLFNFSGPRGVFDIYIGDITKKERGIYSYNSTMTSSTKLICFQQKN